MNTEAILEFVERNQLRWYGHVMRMEEERYPAKFYQWKPRGRSPVGRPRKRRSDGVREAIEARGSAMEMVEEEHYADRARWRSFVRHHN